MDVPAGVTQEEAGHKGFLIHLLSAVRALIFLARRIQPLFSLVDGEVEFCVLKKADSYGNEKLIRKWTKSVFFIRDQKFGQADSYGNEKLIYTKMDQIDRSGCVLIFL